MRSLILFLLLSSCQEQIKDNPSKMRTKKFDTVCVDGFVYYTWQDTPYGTNITPKIGQGGSFITCGEPQKDGL